MISFCQDSKINYIQGRKRVRRVKVLEKKETYMINKKNNIRSLSLASRERGYVKLRPCGNCKVLCDRTKKVNRKYQQDENEFQLSKKDKNDGKIISTHMPSKSHQIKPSLTERISAKKQNLNDDLKVDDIGNDCSSEAHLEYESEEIYEPKVEESRTPTCGVTENSDNVFNKPQRSQFRFRFGRKANRTDRKHQNAYLDIEDLMENEPEFRSRRSKSIDTAMAMTLMPAFSITPSAFNQLAFHNHIIPRLSSDANNMRYLKTLSPRSPISPRAKSGRHPCINHRLEHQNAVECAEGSSNHQNDKEYISHFKMNLDKSSNEHIERQMSNSQSMQSRQNLSKKNSETNKSERSRSLSPPPPAIGMHNWMMRSKMMMDRMVHVGQRPLKAQEIRAAEEAAKQKQGSSSRPSDGCSCGCNCCQCNKEKDNTCNSATCQCKCSTDEGQSQLNTEKEEQQRPWLTMLPRNIFLSEHKKSNNNCTCTCCKEKERNNISDVSVGTAQSSTADKRISTDYNNKDEICQVERDEWPTLCRDCSSCGGIGCRACKDNHSSHRSELKHKTSSPRGFPRRTSTQEKNKCKCTHCTMNNSSENLHESHTKHRTKRASRSKSKKEDGCTMSKHSGNIKSSGKISQNSSRSSSKASADQTDIFSDHQAHCCCGKCGVNFFEEKFAAAALKGLQQYMEEERERLDKEESNRKFSEKRENEVQDSNNSTINRNFPFIMEDKDGLNKISCKCKSINRTDDTKLYNYANINTDGSADVKYLERCSSKSPQRRFLKAGKCQSPSPPVITVDDEILLSNYKTDQNDDLHFKQNSNLDSSNYFTDAEDLNKSGLDNHFKSSKHHESSRARSSSPTKYLSVANGYKAYHCKKGVTGHTNLNTEYDQESEILGGKSKNRGLFCQPLYVDLLPTAARVRRWEKWIEEREKIEEIKNKIRGHHMPLKSLKNISGTILPVRCHSPYRTNGPHRYEYASDLETMESHYQLLSSTQTKERLLSKKENIALCREPMLSHKKSDEETDISSLENSTSDEYTLKEKNEGYYNFQVHRRNSISLPDLCEKLRSASPSFPYDVHADDRYYYLSRSMKDVTVNSTSMQDTKSQHEKHRSVFNQSSKLLNNKPLLFRILNNDKKNCITFLPQSSINYFLNHIKQLLKKQSQATHISSSYAMDSKLGKASSKSLVNLAGSELPKGIDNIESNFMASYFAKELHASNDQLNS